MSIGPRSKILIAAAGMISVGCILLFGLLKMNSPGPVPELQALFQQVISDAAISDQYDWDGAGWDREDVTAKICDRVDVATLVALGMSEKPIWSMPLNGAASKPTYVWGVNQRKSFVAACQDHSIRRLRIEIDAETLACTASIQPFPTCDM